MAKQHDTPLDLLILKTLTRGPSHGFGITLHIQEASGGMLNVEEGSLYPALHRMERDRLLSAEWRITENSRRARYYSITREGKKRLAEVEEHWSRLSRGVDKMLRFA